LEENEKGIEGGDDDGGVEGLNRGDGGGVAVMRVVMVVMQKNKRDGGEDGRFVVAVMKFVEGGEVVTGIVTGMVAGVAAEDVAEEKGLGP